MWVPTRWVRSAPRWSNIAAEAPARAGAHTGSFIVDVAIPSADPVRTTVRSLERLATRIGRPTSPTPQGAMLVGFTPKPSRADWRGWPTSSNATPASTSSPMTAPTPPPSGNADDGTPPDTHASTLKHRHQARRHSRRGHDRHDGAAHPRALPDRTVHAYAPQPPPAHHRYAWMIER